MGPGSKWSLLESSDNFMEEVLKRKETVRPKKPDLKEEFDDVEVNSLVEKAQEMEEKAENGRILVVSFSNPLAPGSGLANKTPLHSPI